MEIGLLAFSNYSYHGNKNSVSFCRLLRHKLPFCPLQCFKNRGARGNLRRRIREIKMMLGCSSIFLSHGCYRRDGRFRWRRWYASMIRGILFSWSCIQCGILLWTRIGVISCIASKFLLISIKLFFRLYFLTRNTLFAVTCTSELIMVSLPCCKYFMFPLWKVHLTIHLIYYK